MIPGVQNYVKKCNFSKTLYIIIDVASAKKLSVDEETSQHDFARVSITATPSNKLRTKMMNETQHSSFKKTVSRLKIKEKCDFAYRIREFTY